MHLPGAIPHLSIYQPHAETCQTPMVACIIRVFNEHVIALCAWLPASTVVWLCGRTKCIQVTWRGIFPIGIGKSMVRLRFIMKCLTGSLGAGQSGGHA